MSLCVGCKACKRECPTGVDMSRMKIEVSAARYRDRGVNLNQWLVANLPSYAPRLAPLYWIANLPNRIGLLRRVLEPITGFSHRRKLPEWRRDIYQSRPQAGGDKTTDTFCRHVQYLF